MGTLIGYPQRMPPRKYAPPNAEVAARIAEAVALFRQLEQIDAEYKAKLAKLIDPEGDKVPVQHMAEQLGVQRKTVYRHLGRSMK